MFHIASSFAPIFRVSRFYAIPRPVSCIIVVVNINCCTRFVVVDLLEQGKSRAISFSRMNAFSTRFVNNNGLPQPFLFLHLCHACTVFVDTIHALLFRWKRFTHLSVSFIKPPLLRHPVGAGWPAPYGLHLIASSGLCTRLAALAGTTWSTLLYF